MKGPVQVHEDALVFSPILSSRIDDEEEHSQPDIIVIKNAQKPTRKSSRMVEEESKQREEGLQRKNQLRQEEQMSRDDKMRIEGLVRKEKLIEQ